MNPGKAAQPLPAGRRWITRADANAHPAAPASTARPVLVGSSRTPRCLFRPAVLLLLCLAALGLHPAQLAAQSPSLTATIQPTSIAPGSQAVLQLRFENGAPPTLPEIPAVPGLQIRYSGQSSERTIVNGNVRSAVVLSYAITTSSNTEPGTYTIPPVRAEVYGIKLASSPVELQIESAPAIDQIAFLTLSFPKSEFYVGEATVADVLLFSRYGGRIGQVPGLSAEGAIVGTNVPINLGQAVQVNTNGSVFSRVGWQIPVTFAKTGPLRFSAEDCVLSIAFRSQRSRDPFGFPSLFNNVENRNFNLASPPVTLTVHPLPTENVPPDFTGAVGRFALEAQVSSTNVAVGDPLTLMVQLSGQGNLDALRWEAPSTWVGLKAYEPTGHLTLDELGLQGARTIEQVLIAESTAVRAIPPLRFTFFDPDQRAYRVLEHPGFALTVTPALTPTAQPMVARAANQDSAAAATDIVHIKNRLGPLALAQPFTPTHAWIPFLATAPLLAWITSLFWRRRSDRLAADPRHARQRHTARRLQQGLLDLRKRAQSNEVEAFHSELFRLLQEILGERLDLPASSITGAVVDQLRRRNVAPDLTHAVEQWFTQCDQARYASQAMTGTLMALYPKAEETLRQLQRLEVNHGS